MAPYTYEDVLAAYIHALRRGNEQVADDLLVMLGELAPTANGSSQELDAEAYGESGDQENVRED